MGHNQSIYENFEAQTLVSVIIQHCTCFVKTETIKNTRWLQYWNQSMFPCDIMVLKLAHELVPKKSLTCAN